MQLILQLKRLGKKKVINVPYQLAVVPANLKELIGAFVDTEVQRYNQKRLELPLLTFLNPQQIQEQAETGKIGFGDIENRQTIAFERAFENALQAFEDGLFVVFIDGTEVKTLEIPIDIHAKSEVAFIRLTFLVGSHY